jgi:methionyl-tRNA formyltransferase
MVVVGYGQIIPQTVIDLAPLGIINVHASLLPKYRGAAPIPWALIRGERATGVTTMKIDPGLDTGDILLQREIEICDDDTTETLSERLSVLGAGLVVETLRGVEQGQIAPRPQDGRLATLAPMLKKTDGLIDWRLKAEEIAWRVRGLRPWPGAYSSFRSKTVHVWRGRAAPDPTTHGLEPGSLLVKQGGLFVACGEATALEITELQLEGRKRLSAHEFLNGIRLKPGEKLS